MFLNRSTGRKRLFTNQIKLDPIRFFALPPFIPSQKPTPQPTPHPALYCDTSLSTARHRCSSLPTHPPLRARPMADAVRPLSTGSVETSDGEQPPSWKPLQSATPPVTTSHATGHSAFSKRFPFLLSRNGRFYAFRGGACRHVMTIDFQTRSTPINVF